MAKPPNYTVGARRSSRMRKAWYKIICLIFLHFLVVLSSSGITLKGRRKRQALHRGVMQKHIMTLAFHPCVFALKTWQMETRTLGDFTAEIKGGFLYTKLSFYYRLLETFFCLYFLKSAHMLCIYIL